MPRLSLKAVLLGNALDITATMIFAMPIYAWLGFRAGITSYAGADADLLGDPEVVGTAWFSVMLFVGCACSVIAGYVAAHIARREVLVHGALAAAFCFFTGAYALLTGYDAVPRVLQLLVLPLGPALGALGGAAWRRWPIAPRHTVTLRKSPAVRRILIGLGYSALTVTCAGIASAFLLSSGCLEQASCSAWETFLSTMLGWTGLVVLVLVLWATGAGYMPGARHQRTHADVETTDSSNVAAV